MLLKCDVRVGERASMNESLGADVSFNVSLDVSVSAGASVSMRVRVNTCVGEREVASVSAYRRR